MSTEVLWINEGFMQDDAGNLIVTSFVDLREPGNRTPIRTLVKGCKREHALEDSETIQMSALEKFRAEGENLIRDPQEGLAQGEVMTVTPETPEQALQRRQNEDLNGGVRTRGFGDRSSESVSRTAIRSEGARVSLSAQSGGSSRPRSLRKTTTSGKHGAQPLIPPTTTSP